MNFVEHDVSHVLRFFLYFGHILAKIEKGINKIYLKPYSGFGPSGPKPRDVIPTY